MDRTNGLRASGRTFRTVLRAILSASHGENIVVVTHNKPYATKLWKAALDICNSYLVGLEFNGINKTITIPNGAVISFVSKEAELDPSDTVVIDHYVHDETLRRAPRGNS